MIEYIFFDESLRDRFVERAASLGVQCTLQSDHMGMIVAVPEDIGEDIEDTLEAYYDELEREQSELLTHEVGGFNRIAGIYYKLPDGQARMVPLPAEIANRLLATFSMEEIQSIFETVADSALHPGEERLCKLLAAGKS